MLTSARMKKIEILTLVADEPKVTETVGELGVLHLTKAPAEGGATVTAQYQCGGATSAVHDSRAVFIRGEEARLRLDVLTHLPHPIVAKPSF